MDAGGSQIIILTARQAGHGQQRRQGQRMRTAVAPSPAALRPVGAEAMVRRRSDKHWIKIGQCCPAGTTW
eukprot:3295768-Karenia_brevis.AAC.1